MCRGLTREYGIVNQASKTRRFRFKEQNKQRWVVEGFRGRLREPNQQQQEHWWRMSSMCVCLCVFSCSFFIMHFIVMPVLQHACAHVQEAFQCSPPNSATVIIFASNYTSYLFSSIVARKLMKSLSLLLRRHYAQCFDYTSCPLWNDLVLLFQSATAITTSCCFLRLLAWDVLKPLLHQEDHMLGCHTSVYRHMDPGSKGVGGWSVLLWMLCSGVRLVDSLSESPNKLVIYTTCKISFKMSINPSN